MKQFVEIDNNELYETEGGFPIGPIIQGALLVIGTLRLGQALYESAKDDAAQAGKRDAYRDMGLTN